MELEAAWVSYEQAYDYHQLMVTDEKACAAAKEAKCLQRDSSDVALDELVALIELKQKTGGAVQDSKDKVVDVAKSVQKLDKKLCATKPQAKEEENFSEKPIMEGICSSLTKELVAEDKQDFMVHPPKQELPKVLISLDPGEVIDLRDKVEDAAKQVQKLAKELLAEDKQDFMVHLLKQELPKVLIRSNGGLDPARSASPRIGWR